MNEKIDPFKRISKYNFDKIIFELTNYHKNNCSFYKKIFLFEKKFKNIKSIPPIPTRLFKINELASIPSKKIFKTMYSSGTSGLQSKIILDKNNSIRQVKALKKIFGPFLGYERHPMIIVDNLKNLKDQKEFNAKKAAISGFSIFGKDYFYLLDKENNIDYKNLKIFLNKYRNKKILIFGFTEKIFEIFYKKNQLYDKNISFKNSIIIHGGGWKKLEKFKISNSKFKKEITKKYNFDKIINYYGMIEQTGSIFIECENCGAFKTSCFSDVYVRDNNFHIQNYGKGLLQLFSLLPSSYPGHNIITEDEGEILRDNCKSCNQSKRFLVFGRAKNSEIRGCSNV